jgi:hypothetical protein
MIDDEIQKAIRIGETNKEVIQLAHNWCGHLGVEIRGGVGLVEAETGLPIGMRSFKCPYASAQGFAGMDLRSIVLDFYDRNCVGCKQRLPIRLPNLSGLVAERDTAQRRAKELAHSEKVRQLAKLDARAARREQLSAHCAPAQSGLFELIDRLDREPNEETKRVLLETAAAVPSKFDRAVQDALFDLLDTGRHLSTAAALEVLLKIEADSARVCDAALKLLASGHHSRLAGQAVQKGLSTQHDHLITDALVGIIHFAMSSHGFLGGRHDVGDPLPLLRAYDLFPSKVLISLREQLRRPEKQFRIEACNAILLIMQINPDFATQIADEIARSVGLPDDIYGESGSSAHWAARALAQALLYRPEAIDELIQQQLSFADEEKADALLDVYHQVLRRDDLDNPDDHDKAGHAIAYSRLVELVTRNTETHTLRKVLHFLQHVAADFPELLARHAETLLGGAALIAEELEQPQVAGSSLSLKPDMLKVMENASRRLTLNSALTALGSLLGLAASRAPNSFGALTINMFEDLGEQHARLKAVLVKCFEKMAACNASLAMTIPPLYKAMTDQASLVRSSAANACAALSHYSPEDLPDLLYETFLLLLSDPYVIVHQAAVEALRTFRLPAKLAARVPQLLTMLIGTYRNSRSDDRFLSSCINRLLAMSKKDFTLPVEVHKVIIKLVAEIDPDAAMEVVKHQGRTLRGSPGYTALIVKLMTASELSEYSITDLIEELYASSPSEIRAEAEKLRAVVKNCSAQEYDITNELLEILTIAGMWGTAADIAVDATAKFDDTAWDRGQKLRSLARQLSAQIELAAENRDFDGVGDLTVRWRGTLRQIKQDNEDNEKKRDPFFGIPMPNPGE